MSERRHRWQRWLLAGTLVLASCSASEQPGPKRFHRLNRAEYNNSVRDLLGVALQPADDFPADDPSLGFDNNAASLSLSPLQFELYERAAAKLASRALAPGTTSRDQLLPCADTAETTKHADTCIAELIDELGPRVWRRPLTNEELMALSELGSGEPLAVRAELVVQAMLLSPNFLYRSEPVAAAGETIWLNSHELAARLSYFLWSSTPDDDLLAAAQTGELLDPATLRGQVERMLDDPRAYALITNFGGQWLSFRALDNVFKDAHRYPLFDDELRASMATEAALTFADFVGQNRDLRELLTFETSYIDTRLAELYGVADPGPGFVAVDLAGAERQGILTQAGFLTVHSYPFTTSPARRGRWVLDHLLCQPPAPAPDGVDIPIDPVSGTKREELDAHRQNPACAACHDSLDPLGLAFETYDPIGQLRTLENGEPIDPAGALPSGAPFANARELSTLLADDPRVVDCMIQQVLVYALGRGLTASEHRHIDTLAAELRERGTGARDLFAVVAVSELFRQAAPAAAEEAP